MRNYLQRLNCSGIVSVLSDLIERTEYSTQNSSCRGSQGPEGERFIRFMLPFFLLLIRIHIIRAMKKSELTLMVMAD